MRLSQLLLKEDITYTSASEEKLDWKGLGLLGSPWHPIFTISLGDAIPAPTMCFPNPPSVILMNSHCPLSASLHTAPERNIGATARKLTCHHWLSVGLPLVMSTNSNPAKKGGGGRVVTTKSLTSNLLSPWPPLGNCSLHIRKQLNGTWGLAYTVHVSRTPLQEDSETTRG